MGLGPICLEKTVKKAGWKNSTYIYWGYETIYEMQGLKTIEWKELFLLETEKLQGSINVVASMLLRTFLKILIF